MKRSPAQIDDIVQRLRSRHVPTSRDRLVRSELDRLLRRNANDEVIPVPVLFTGNTETRGIVVTDDPGGGKTTILRHVLSTHPALGPGPAGAARYLSVSVPSPATLKSFGCEILRRTGYADVSERRERWSIWRMVHHRLAALGIVCLMVDEAHDLRSGGSIKEAHDILNAFKSLLTGDSPIILILSGIPVLNEMMLLDEQSERRYARIEFPRVTDASEGNQLRSLIRSYCEFAGLQPPEVDVVPRLIYAARNRFGLCVESVVNAIETALGMGASTLTLEHFARSWATTFGREGYENPFLSRDWAKIDLRTRFEPNSIKRGY